MIKNLIGVGGYATAGKDAFADALVSVGYEKTFMAAPLELALLTIDPWIRTSAGSYIKYAYLHETVGYDQSKKHEEVRELLQKIGTEFGRRQISNSIWVDAMRRWLLATDAEHVVVTGIRYPNELALIRTASNARRTLAVWIDRPGVEAVNQHSSEHTLTAEDFDAVIENDGLLEDLQAKAREFQP